MEHQKWISINVPSHSEACLCIELMLTLGDAIDSVPASLGYKPSFSWLQAQLLLVTSPASLGYKPSILPLLFHSAIILCTHKIMLVSQQFGQYQEVLHQSLGEALA